MPVTVERALVVGAGIAGLSTAIALLRHDIDTHVMERAPQVRGEGGGIHLWHNAMSGYRDLGLAEEVAAAGTVMREAQFRTSRDRLLAVWPLHELDRQHGTVTVGIARTDLLEVLLAHIPAANVHPASTVVDVAADDAGVKVTLADGRVEGTDLLIGADGIRSTVRKATIGRTATRYAGYAVWQGTVEDFPTTRARPGEFRLYYGPGSRFAWYHIGSGRLYWFALHDAPEQHEEGEADPRPALAARFAGWPDPVPDLPLATPVKDVQRFAMRDRPPDRGWSGAHVTLVGDAAHAMTFNIGQGACMGVEDAVVLASSLRLCDTLPEALARYEHLRAPRTARYITRSWRLGTLARWRHPAAVAVREAVLRVVLPSVAWRSHRTEMTYET